MGTRYSKVSPVRDAEGEGTLAGLLEEAGVAALAGHLAVDLLGDLLLEDLAGDLLLAVPVGEAVDQRALAEQHGEAALERLLAVVRVGRAQHGVGVLAVDARLDLLVDDGQRRRGLAAVARAGVEADLGGGRAWQGRDGEDEDDGAKA
jgi:hypothetical protein